MENNNKDFMNNRPVVAGVNQTQEVYGSQSRKSNIVTTIIFCIIAAVGAVIGFITNSVFAYIFLFAFVVLVISTIIVSVSNKHNAPPLKKTDKPDAIFKEYDI